MLLVASKVAGKRFPVSMSTTSILIDLFKNGLRMGPLVNARMTAASTLALPHGVAFAGAQGAIQAVQSGANHFVQTNCIREFAQHWAPAGTTAC